MRISRLFTASIALVGIIQLSTATTYRVDLGKGAGALGKISAKQVSSAIEHAASQLKAGDALILPAQSEFDTVSMPALPSDVQIFGGQGKVMKLKGLAKGTSFVGGNYSLDALSEKAVLDNTFFIHQGSNGALSQFGNLSNTYFIDYIAGIKALGTWENVTGVWMRYNHEHQFNEAKPSWDFDLMGSGKNVKILCAIEHNQGNGRQAVRISNADGMALAGGSTESGSSYETRPVYEILNSKNVYLGHRRFFSGRGTRGGGATRSDWIEACKGDKNCWKGWPIYSLGVTNSQNIYLDQIVDLANPFIASVIIDAKSTVNMFSMSTEDKLLLPPAAAGRNIFMYSVTPNSMSNIAYHEPLWQEPRRINDENLLLYLKDDKQYDATKGEWTKGIVAPAPPVYPKCDIPKIPNMLYKQAAGFGAAALAAGADPTGQKPSDAAFAKAIRENGVLEIPAGTFLLNTGIDVSSQSGSVNIVGAGMGKTILIGKGANAVITESPALAKSNADKVNLGTNVTLYDVTKDGQGTQEYGVTDLKINSVYINVEWKNYTKACVYKTTGDVEQFRFINCKFSGGEYGVRYSGYADKPLFFNCSFENHSKGGIYTTEIVHFHGGVYQCSFKNIGGPGVKIGGGAMNVGYGPWVFSVDNCTFIECGNETEAAVELGYNWLGAFSNSTVTTTSKTILAGFRGNFGIIDSVVIDVKAKDNQAMWLGHQRFEATAGVGGARMRAVEVKQGGMIRFMDRQEAMQDEPGRPSAGEGNKFLKYGADMYKEFPYAFTHMFYRVKSANINEAYAIYNSGVKAFDLSTDSLTVGVKKQGIVNQVKAEGQLGVYDTQGRYKGIYQGGKSNSSGLNFVKPLNKKGDTRKVIGL